MSEELRIKTGGLMRCCIQSLHEYHADPDQPLDGAAVVPCKHCDSHMRWNDKGYWEWDRESRA